MSLHAPLTLTQGALQLTMLYTTRSRAVCTPTHVPNAHYLTHHIISRIFRMSRIHRLHSRRHIPVGPTRSSLYSGHYDGASSDTVAFAATHFADDLDVMLKRAKVRRHPFIGSFPTTTTASGTWTSRPSTYGLRKRAKRRYHQGILVHDDCDTWATQKYSDACNCTPLGLGRISPHDTVSPQINPTTTFSAGLGTFEVKQTPCSGDVQLSLSPEQQLDTKTTPEYKSPTEFASPYIGTAGQRRCRHHIYI